MKTTYGAIRNCPGCDADVSAPSRFCPECGAFVPVAVEHPNGTVTALRIAKWLVVLLLMPLGIIMTPLEWNEPLPRWIAVLVLGTILAACITLAAALLIGRLD